MGVSAELVHVVALFYMQIVETPAHAGLGMRALLAPASSPVVLVCFPGSDVQETWSGGAPPTGGVGPKLRVANPLRWFAARLGPPARSQAMHVHVHICSSACTCT